MASITMASIVNVKADNMICGYIINKSFSIIQSHVKALEFSFFFFHLPVRIMQGPNNLIKYYMYLSKAVNCIPLLFWITHVGTL